MFFLIFISLFFLVVYAVRFDTNKKRHFLTCMLTRVPNFTTFDGTTFNNDGRKEF